VKNANVFLKLREEGCPKKAAIVFSSKESCRHDSTKLQDGPIGFRVLKLKESPKHAIM